MIFWRKFAKSKFKSFTLMELMVAVSIFALVSVLLTAFIINIMHLSARFSLQRQLNQQMTNLLETISREARIAQQVSGEDGVKVDGDTLTLRVAPGYEKIYSLVGDSGGRHIQVAYQPYEATEHNQVDIMLVLDMSGSMKRLANPLDSKTKIEALRNSAKGFVDIIQGKTSYDAQIGIISFDVEAHKISALTKDWETLKDNIDPIAPTEAIGASTDTCAGIDLANEKILEDRQSANKIIILMSDGRANIACGKELPPDESSQKAIEKSQEGWSNITYYTIGFGMINRSHNFSCYTLDLSEGSDNFIDELTLRKIAQDYLLPETIPLPKVPYGAWFQFRDCWEELQRSPETYPGSTSDYDSNCPQTVQGLFDALPLSSPNTCEDNSDISRYYHAPDSGTLSIAFNSIAYNIIYTYETTVGEKESGMTSDSFDASEPYGKDLFKWNSDYGFLKINIQIESISGAPAWQSVGGIYQTTITTRDYEQYAN